MSITRGNNTTGEGVSFSITIIFNITPLLDPEIADENKKCGGGEGEGEGGMLYIPVGKSLIGLQEYGR